MTTLSRRLAWPVLLGGVLSLPSALKAQEVVAVLSSDSAYYQEPFAEFERLLATPVQRYILSERAPKLRHGVRVAVTYGSEAAYRDYPRGVAVVFCMAPGVRTRTFDPDARDVRVHILPPAEYLAAQLQTLQPGLKSLAVFVVSNSDDDYYRELGARASARGMTVKLVRLRGAEALPDGLREMKETPDAIWLPPDPMLVTKETLEILNTYSKDRKVPLYVPTAGLLSRAGVAAIHASLKAIGAAAASAARGILEGKPVPSDVYVPKGETVLSLAAAREAGLPVSQSIRNVDRILP